MVRGVEGDQRSDISDQEPKRVHCLQSTANSWELIARGREEFEKRNPKNEPGGKTR